MVSLSSSSDNLVAKNIAVIISCFLDLLCWNNLRPIGQQAKKDAMTILDQYQRRILTIEALNEMLQMKGASVQFTFLYLIM